MKPTIDGIPYTPHIHRAFGFAPAIAILSLGERHFGKLATFILADGRTCPMALLSIDDLNDPALDRLSPADKSRLTAHLGVATMNELTIVSNDHVATMTSLELVEFINSQRAPEESVLRHDNFMAKVPKVLGEKDALKFKAIYQDAYGRDKAMYRFPKREACLMAMSYSYDLQAKVFDHMTELEEQLAKPQHVIPQTLPEALRLAADLAEQRNAAQAALAIAAPKAEALDRIADAEGAVNPTVAAKTLQVQPKKLFDWLREHRWIYRRPGGSSNVAYQDKIQAGYLTHKITTVERPDGTEKVVEQVLVTGKGLSKLSQVFGQPWLVGMSA